MANLHIISITVKSLITILIPFFPFSFLIRLFKLLNKILKYNLYYFLIYHFQF